MRPERTLNESFMKSEHAILLTPEGADEYFTLSSEMQCTLHKMEFSALTVISYFK
jgi:hypothetical protein